MPVYDGECQQCGCYSEFTCAVSERHDRRGCPGCGGEMKLVIINAPKGFVKGKFEPFRSVVDGSLISSQRSMDEHNKRNNVVCMADGYSEEKIIAGDFGHKPQVLDKKELAADIAESIQQVQSGYKPQIGDDDGR